MLFEVVYTEGDSADEETLAKIVRNYVFEAAIVMGPRGLRIEPGTLPKMLQCRGTPYVRVHEQLAK